MFEESEDASLTARNEAARDRNYVDGNQITADELAGLARRSQLPVIDNREWGPSLSGRCDKVRETGVSSQ